MRRIDGTGAATAAAILALVSAAALAGCGGRGGAAAGASAAAALPSGGADASGPGGGAAAPLPGHPATGLIPRSALFGNPDRASPQISPDGKWLSYLAPRDGVLNVWVAPIGDLGAARPVTAERARPVEEYAWTYGSERILYLQDAGGDEKFHVFSVPVAEAGGAPLDLTPIADIQAEILAQSPRHPGVVLLGINDRNPELHDVYRVDVQTGARTLVQENSGFLSFHFDEELVPRLALSMSADGGMILHRADRPGRKRAGKPAEAARWQPFLTIPAEDTTATGVLGFDRSGKSVYLQDSRGRDTSAIYRLDLATGKSTLLAEDPGADVGAVLIHPLNRTVQAVVFEHARADWKVLDPAIAPDLAAIRAAAAEANGACDVTIVGRSLDDATWIVSVVADAAPIKTYRWDRARQALTFLFVSNSRLVDAPLAHMHPVTIAARDGLSMIGYLSLPPAADPDGDGAPSAPLPMVLWVHGGPWARDSWGYHRVHQLLANRGYAVLSVNYRGSTGFGKAFVNAGQRQWGKAMQDDLLDAVDWAVRQRITAADTVCIGGASYGGYATLVGLSMTPTAFRCGIDAVGPSNLLTFIDAVPPYWKPWLDFLKKHLGDWTTEEGRAALLAVSPLTHAAAIRRPLLIAHGANDPRAKRAESDQIVQALRDHHIPVTYALFPDEGHGFHRPENEIAFFALVEQFLSVYLGGVYQPITPEELSASSLELLQQGQDQASK